MRIRLHEGMKIAKKVLALVEKKLDKEVAKNCRVEGYANGRENGLSIFYYDGRGKRVCFAENRNSDSIVCYWGDYMDFNISSNILNEKAYKNGQKEYFAPDEFEKAANCIVNFFKG